MLMPWQNIIRLNLFSFFFNLFVCVALPTLFPSQFRHILCSAHMCWNIWTSAAIQLLFTSVFYSPVQWNNVSLNISFAMIIGFYLQNFIWIWVYLEEKKHTQFFFSRCILCNVYTNFFLLSRFGFVTSVLVYLQRNRFPFGRFSQFDTWK